MDFRFVKATAQRVGLYRQARWVHRHVLKRDELAVFRAECALYRPFVQPGDLCFDVGGNYGVKTEVFLALGGNVVAFEPQPDCYRELRARNPRAVALRTAVGASPGTALMYVDRHRTGSSLVSSWRNTPEGTLEVPVTTLDAAIDEYGLPRVCKIDVEGFELEVLRGLTQRIPLLSFEFHRHRVDDASACMDYLERFGGFETNFTPRDVPRFVSDAWLDQGEARTFLQQTVPSSADYDWGDVFVRFLT